MPRLPPQAGAGARLLILVRGVRSLSQGALVVDFALYLRTLHWSGAEIGALLTLSMAAGMVLTLILGPLSDRLGCKRLILGFEAGRIVAALVALATSNPILISGATFLGQYGRGGNGSAGPFGAVEKSWLAHRAPRVEWVRLYSLNSAAGFAGHAAGALLAVLPAFLTPWLPGALSFRPLFAFALFTSLLSIGLMLRVPDAAGARRGRQSANPAPAASPEGSRQENRLLLRLVAANLAQGAGIGLSGPMISYWFAQRFGAGPALVGPVMAAGFLLSAAASVLAGRLARKHGIVPVVVGMRLVGIGLLMALPLAPALPAAAALQMLRSLFNRGTNGVRQALSIALVGSRRRGFAASLNSLSVSVPRAFGPLFAGLFFDAGWFAAPFLLAGGFQAAYLGLYAASFARHERESRASALSFAGE